MIAEEMIFSKIEVIFKKHLFNSCFSIFTFKISYLIDMKFRLLLWWYVLSGETLQTC